jgi:hypothetical protein
MKPFYLLLLIIGIPITIIGIWISIDSIKLYMVLQDIYVAEGLNNHIQDHIAVIVIGAITFLIGLLISLFSYRRLKTITRTD